jgi:lipopolysaccharide/colanic/teichoic acid biosynthesis glycosyltransferase
MSYIQTDRAVLSGSEGVRAAGVGGGRLFWHSKRVFDILFSLVLLVPLAICTLLLLALNPIWNKGPLFYSQVRMGRGCRAFKAIKFRSMRSEKVKRGANDPIETDRITPLGQFLRRSRIDELPQVWNVLRGEMSLIGPRPDYFSHAKTYLRDVPGYRLRHVVRPGISGLAQVDIGYVEGTEATRAKVAADLRYIREAGPRMELHIFWKTLRTVLGQKGS